MLKAAGAFTSCFPGGKQRSNVKEEQQPQAVAGPDSFAKLMSMREAAPAHITFALNHSDAGQWRWSWALHQKSKQGKQQPAAQPKWCTSLPASTATGNDTAGQSSSDWPGHSSSHERSSTERNRHHRVSWEAQVKLQLPEHLLARDCFSSNCGLVQSTAGLGQQRNSLANAAQKSAGARPNAGSKSGDAVKHSRKLRQAIIKLQTDLDASEPSVSWTTDNMRSNELSGRRYHGSPALLKSALQKCVRRRLHQQAVR